jgi:ubiquinone/menaquinone biosynthesis C-methylase UbiE
MDKNKQMEVFNKRGQKYLRSNQRMIWAAQHRHRLLREAQGKTLEIGVGAGANLALYNPNVELTAVDFSTVLLQAADKYAKAIERPVTFIQADVETLFFPENSFDTIVSTLTLCAYPDPVAVLKRINEWCKPDGNILLFEHGLSSHNFLNWLLNSLESWHLKTQGCHSNLDILGVIQASEVDVQKMETAYFGTHHLIWAKPNKK